MLTHAFPFLMHFTQFSCKFYQFCGPWEHFPPSFGVKMRPRPWILMRMALSCVTSECSLRQIHTLYLKKMKVVIIALQKVLGPMSGS